MADAAVALTNSASNLTTRAAQAIRGLQDARNRRQRLLDESEHLNHTASLDLDVRAQIDEVFLVLALLGEVLLPLRVLDNEYYPQTLGNVETSILSGGHELMHVAFAELSAELQYVITAGFAFCSTFAPMPVYRGFGAAILGDWSWGCPILETTVKKMMVKTGTLLGLKKERDPQPNRPVLLAFDKVIQLLQVKQNNFLRHKPIINSAAEQQPRYSPKPEKEVARDIDKLETYTKKIEKLGHPSPPGVKVVSWAAPYATWDSPYSCKMQKSRDIWRTIMTNQMDPGRLLHAFICRNNVNLIEGQLLVLPFGTPAESLICWLEGLPGMTHRILKWSDLDTKYFEEKCGKSLRKRLGQYPLPDRFAAWDQKMTLRSPSPLLTVPTSPPPYTEDSIVRMGTTRIVNQVATPPPAVELATERDLVELDATTAPCSPGNLHTAASTSALDDGKNSSTRKAEIASASKSIPQFRRKPKSDTASTPSHPSVALPKPPAAASSKVRSPKVEISSTSKFALPYSPSARESEQASKVADSKSAAAKDVTGSSTTYAVHAELPTESNFRQFGDADVRPLPGDAASNHEDSDANSHTERPPLPARPGPHPSAGSSAGKLDSTAVSPTQNEDKDVDLQTTEPRSTPETTTVAKEIPSPKEDSSNHYLELLNKVAGGQISPQALQEMLQQSTPP